MKNNRGITLVALVITVVVILILIGTTVDIAIDGRLFDKAQSSADDEKDHINKTQNEIDKIKDEWNEIEAGVEGTVPTGPLPVELTIRFGEHNNADEYIPFTGVKFRVYKFGEFDENGGIIVDSKFANYPGFAEIDLSSPPNVDELARYITGDDINLKPFVGTTNANGEITYALASNGAYIIVGEMYEMGTNKYVPVPQLALGGIKAEWAKNDSVLEVPTTTYDMKYTSTITRNIVVVWEDEGHENRRPTVVNMNLWGFEGKELVHSEFIGLRETENWRTSLNDLDSNKSWELIHPLTAYEYDAYYDMSVKLQGITFVVTMTFWGDDAVPAPVPDEEPVL